MKYTFTTMATPELGVKEIINEAIAYKFDGIDFRIKTNKGGEISENISCDEVKVINLCLTGNTEISSLLCYNANLRSGKEEMISSILKCIGVADILSVKMIRIFSGRILNAEDFNDLCYVLKKVFELSNSNVKILLQNHLNLGITCRQALDIKNIIDDKRYGFIFSPDQAHKGKEDYINILDEIADIINQIYIADIDDENKYTLIGNGIIPFDKIMDRMTKHKYDNYITLKWEKCWCDYLPEYKEGFKSFKNYFGF